jgi:UDP-N-acetylmuramoyl-L-alanyl-D-glutamate--2,6-diaminopimelate ligase
MLYTIAVVGTSGKSTTTWLTRHLLARAGCRVGVMSSVGNFYGDETVQHIPHGLRYAGARYLEHSLEQIERAGCTHAVIECSAGEARLAALPNVTLETAVWTTLHADDMDYQGDTEANFRDKWRVMQGARCAIVNVCDAWGARHAGAACLTYADDAPADWRASAVVSHPFGSEFTVHARGTVFRTALPVAGRHNVSNALGALAASARAGVDTQTLAEHLETFRGVPARMQLIAAAPVRVFVDFANTSSRLNASVQALRPTTARALRVVTGSPDDARYVPDRAALGEVATRGADHVIITEAGYSTHAPEEIAAQVAGGAARHNYEIVFDRAAAIRHALATAEPGDTVLIAGKGTEETIARGDILRPWNEAEVVRELARIQYGDAIRYKE